MDHRMPFRAGMAASIIRGLKHSTLRSVTVRNSRLYRCDTGEDWQIDPRDCGEWDCQRFVPLLCRGALGEALQVHPRIQPGDRLLVCEPLVRSDAGAGPLTLFVPTYEADGNEAGGVWRWEASRLSGMYLQTDLVRYAVTVESVTPRMSASELTDEEIMREGVYPAHDESGRCWYEWYDADDGYPTPRDAWRALWTGIHGAGSFEARSPLWLYRFGDVEEVTR